MSTSIDHLIESSIDTNRRTRQLSRMRQWWSEFGDALKAEKGAPRSPKRSVRWMARITQVVGFGLAVLLSGGE